MFLAVLCGGCVRSSEPVEAATKEPLVMLTGPSTGAYAPFGDALAAAFNERLAGAHITPVSTEGPEGAAGNAHAIETGAATLAFSRADLAYGVYRSGADPNQRSTSHLRSIAVLYTNSVHVLVRRASGIKRAQDIRGHRVYLGANDGANAVARLVVGAFGIGAGDIQEVQDGRNFVSRLRSGELDASVFATAYPVGAIDDISESSPLSLLSLEPSTVDDIRARSPFFKATVIPRGTYRGQENDVTTIGMQGLLICRDTTPEPLVYNLTKAFFDALPKLATTQVPARLINVDLAPATPVPLHPGAARYYRERDLFR